MLAKTKNRKLLGDDDGHFAHALWCVRTYGGVIEHPEASHAFRYFGLERPQRDGGWSSLDMYGGRVCCVAQGHYGHKAQKLTWLYVVDIKFKNLKWGPASGLVRLDEGFHSKEERARAVKTGVCQRLSSRQCSETPKKFRDLLIGMVR